MTTKFADWLNGIKDKTTQRRLARRIAKLELGNWGDYKVLAPNVYELREFFGSGYRMYCHKRGDVLILMLVGGDKSSQAQDIKTALKLAQEWEDE